MGNKGEKHVMTAMSRRTLFEAGTLAMAAVAGIPQTADADAGRCLSPETEAIIRKHYQTWIDKDWHTENMLLADDFTFSSANGDDHISKAKFKTRCWDSNINDIKHFNLRRIFGGGNEAFVLAECTTMDDKTFTNVEYHRIRDGKIASIECYFGAPANFPSAVSARKT